jgi:transmembrane sensor
MKPSSTLTRKQSDREIELAASRWIGRRDAGMTPNETIEFEAWCRADPRNERAYARHDATWRLFARPAEAGQADDLVAALATSRTRRQNRRRAVIGASLALALAFGAVWQRSEPPGTAPQLADARTGGALVILPEKKSLPDGTLVELKHGADLTVEFTNERRHVKLKHGEALFHVVKDPRRPFVVTAAGVAVRAVGTAFSVQFERDEVGVLVTEGRVAVETAPHVAASAVTGNSPTAGSPAAGTSPVATNAINPSSLPAVASAPAPTSASSSPPFSASTLAANTTLHLDAGQHTLVIPAASAPPRAETLSPAELAARLAWRSPRLEFTSTPLQEAIDLFNRYAADSGAQRLVIEPADPSLAQLEVSGYFRANNVAAFLHLISQTLGVNAEAHSDRIALRRAR